MKLQVICKQPNGLMVYWHIYATNQLQQHMRIKALLFPVMVGVFWQPLQAQLPYTQKQYAVSVETDIPYGTATTFAGGTENLVLDLYKPIGDDHCQRPLLVMVHGGGFIAGTKNDADVVQICQEMAARGHVTASVHYRLGLHPLDFYVPYALCNDAINPLGINKCIYAADDMELRRAHFRAVQDVKGAIRFLKGRREQDSTDVRNVFVGGSSAGAITAIGVAYIDLPDEKPYQAGAWPDAPMPDPDLASCVPAPADRSRPDLGSIDGELHLDNGHDASVQGVASFMGGMFEIGLPLQGIDTPAIYLYHRTDDLVVPVDSDPLFMLYPYCLNPINLCQPLEHRPETFGSRFIAVTWSVMGSSAPPLFDDILEYGLANGDDCLDDPPGHSINNIPLRCENLSAFFADIIADNGNSPTGNCVSGTDFTEIENGLRVYPNPAKGGELNVTCSSCAGSIVTFRLLDIAGRTVAETKGNPQSFHWKLPDVHSGLYFLQIISPTWNEVLRVAF